MNNLHVEIIKLYSLARSLEALFLDRHGMYAMSKTIVSMHIFKCYLNTIYNAKTSWEISGLCFLIGKILRNRMN